MSYLPQTAEHIRLVSARIATQFTGRAEIPFGGYALYYFIESHARLTLGRQCREIDRRNIAMFSFRADYRIDCENSALCEMIFAPCEPEDSQFCLRQESENSRALQQFVRRIHPSLILNDSESLYLILLHILCVLEHGSSGQHLALCALVSTLFIKLSLNCCYHNRPNAVRIISAAQSYIFEHRLEDLSTDDIARHLGISRSWLQTLFAKYKHHTIRDYIVHLRVDDAALLMLFSDKTIAQVAEVCGFRSRQHFTRVFEDQMGISPGRYRRLIFDGIRFSGIHYSL